MGPHFSPGSRAIEGAGNPSSQFPIKPQLDHDASPLVIGLRPDAGLEAPCSGVCTFNSREAAAVEIRKMLPVDRVFVQPLKTHGQLTTIGADMRHRSLVTKVLHTCRPPRRNWHSFCRRAACAPVRGFKQARSDVTGN